MLEILARSEQPARDRLTFALAQLAFWRLAAIDGHGPRKLPLQDVKLAMALRGQRPHYLLREIQPRHFERLAVSRGDPGAWPAMQALVQSVPAAFEQVATRLPAGFSDNVWNAISKGLLHQRERFLSELHSTSARGSSARMPRLP